MADSYSVTYNYHLLNDTIIYWCSKNTFRNISKSETRAIYTCVVDQKWIRNFCRYIGYTTGYPSKIYQYNQYIIKLVLAYMITPQAQPLDILITALHEYRI